MIIGFDREPIIGERRFGLVDYKKQYQDVPFVVLRQVTVEDYIQYAINNGVSPERANGIKVRKPNAFYYEISVD